MTRPFLGLAILLALSISLFSQRPGDVLATSKNRTITLSDLSAATVTAVSDAPTQRIALRTALFDRFVYERLISRANGNVIEEHRFDWKGRLELVTAFKYEYDANGNWVVRRLFERKTLRGASPARPSSTQFRIISYY